MAELIWDKVGERLFETGADHGVLYKPDAGGAYSTGVVWNGLVTVTQSPSGAEATPQYADNIKYINLVSAEDFSATIEAFMSPPEFDEHDGSAAPTPGIRIGQQVRKPFGFSYRSRVGNDVAGSDFGYKLNLIYGALAAPTEKAHATINDTPEAATLSWEVTTSPVSVGTINGKSYKPTAILTIDSTQVSASKLAELETILYGTASVDPRMPLPAEVINMFLTTLIESAQPVAPTYNSATKQITFPVTTGVDYKVDGITRTTPLTITKNTVVTAAPKNGYKLPAVTDDEFLVTYS
jgi:hypothetical protein